MNDLYSKYKAETGKKKQDIVLSLVVNEEGEINIDKEYLEDYELENIGMSKPFIQAVNIGFDTTDDLTIIDPEYVAWLESVINLNGKK